MSEHPHLPHMLPRGEALSLEQLYEKMALIREVEERLLELFSQGKLFGTTHTYSGQETIAAGILSQLQPGDIVFSNHRCHGHYLAFTDDVEGLISELMGKRAGVCRGIGGSQHLCAKNIYTNGVLGSIMPNAVGMALAEKRQGRRSVTTVFLGDGAMGEGVVYESMNMAGLWSAPVLIVIEDNHYAQSTPSRLQVAGKLADRPRAFGIATREMAGNDVEEIHRAAGAILKEMREQPRPHCLVIDTYRLNPHSKGDDVRDKQEIEAHRKADPLLATRGRLGGDAAMKIDDRCRQRVAAAIEKALAADWADQSCLPGNLSVP